MQTIGLVESQIQSLRIEIEEKESPFENKIEKLDAKIDLIRDERDVIIDPLQRKLEKKEELLAKLERDYYKANPPTNNEEFVKWAKGMDPDCYDDVTPVRPKELPNNTIIFGGKDWFRKIYIAVQDGKIIAILELELPQHRGDYTSAKAKVKNRKMKFYNDEGEVLGGWRTDRDGGWVADVKKPYNQWLAQVKDACGMATEWVIFNDCTNYRDINDDGMKFLQENGEWGNLKTAIIFNRVSKVRKAQGKLEYGNPVIFELDTAESSYEYIEHRKCYCKK